MAPSNSYVDASFIASLNYQGEVKANVLSSMRSSSGASNMALSP
ncbi:hypothetical protein SAMN05216386_1795 [Nitrosospira briensis]|uniref:Uncharacterized protein n=1 Tax=Nitrosospira briensis TaxID=35799 RepID=A0A1I5BSE7_9PROT|nr:hypothetical protein [Nitrosospira briensis]SFN77573.1 hypothetical protein SAMN05216386_1795 [Nitrosospira briensis]